MSSPTKFNKYNGSKVTICLIVLMLVLLTVLFTVFPILNDIRLNNFIHTNKSIKDIEKINRTVTVKTTTGVLKGKKFELFKKNIYSFEGVPYAEPPIGELRFQK